jgi:hypothetical protein
MLMVSTRMETTANNAQLTVKNVLAPPFVTFAFLLFINIKDKPALIALPWGLLK